MSTLTIVIVVVLIAIAVACGASSVHRQRRLFRNQLSFVAR